MRYIKLLDLLSERCESDPSCWKAIQTQDSKICPYCMILMDLDYIIADLEQDPKNLERQAKLQARKATQYLQSPEGQADIKESLRKHNLALEERKKASKVDWQTMHRPMDI